LMLAGATCIFFAALDCDVGRVPRLFLYFGKITYGLYVFHFLCLEMATRAADALGLAPHERFALMGLHLTIALFAMALTAGCAMVSYEFLEKPFLELKRRFTAVPSRPV
jgi:peptidoglycan/LPS O-acetylase OafA/YrhL